MGKQGPSGSRAQSSPATLAILPELKVLSSVLPSALLWDQLLEYPELKCLAQRGGLMEAGGIQHQVEDPSDRKSLCAQDAPVSQALSPQPHRRASMAGSGLQRLPKAGFRGGLEHHSGAAAPTAPTSAWQSQNLPFSRFLEEQCLPR